MLRARYRRDGDRRDLDAAVDASRQAADITPPGQTHHAEYLSNYGGALLTQYEVTGNHADLNAAIDMTQQAVAATPASDPERAAYLSALGSALGVRYERDGEHTDLDEAIQAAQQAADSTPCGAPDRAGYLSNLATALLARSRRAGGEADLDAAIQATREAIEAAGAGDPHLSTYLANLGAYLSARYQRAGNRADLDAAIDAARQAVTTGRAGNPERAMHLSNLSAIELIRWELTGDHANLDAAIDTARQAVEAIPPSHPNLGMALSNLQAALGTRYTQKGARADLNAAIDAGQRALAATPPRHAEYPSRLTNLGNSLHDRYRRDGDVAALDQAIEVQRQAVEAAGPGHPDHSGYLANLGRALLARYEQAVDRADLDAAIDAGRRAVTAGRPGQPALAGHLASLGASLSIRYGRSEDLADLDAAIDAEREAVLLTPTGHPARASHLSTLGASLAARSHRTGDRGDLDAAIDAAREAVAATRPGYPDLARYLANLGISLRIRYQQTGDPGDLDAAVGAGHEAVAAIQPGHPDRTRYLANLAASLRIRHERTGEQADLDAALGFWRQASQVSAGTPVMRLAAARSWGSTAAGQARMDEAADGYAAAVSLLPAVAWHGMDRPVREEQLTHWAGLAADAAACATQAGHPERAVELLEQGRSVLWTQALNLRSDLTRLADVAPELAGRLDGIRMVLDSPEPVLLADAAASVPVRNRHQQDAADLRRRKAREWDDVLAQVRDLDGFAHFLGAIPYAELAQAASAGPVVIVNASRHGCHALIVEAGSDQARVVDLPRLHRDAAIDHADAMLRALAGAANPARKFTQREKDRHSVLDVLDWLWDVLAEPVLGALGHISTPEAGAPWPRVWWCPTGPLTMLPIHAAGHHPRLGSTGAGAKCVPGRVVSSYTPTLSALGRARHAATSAVRQLTVGMPRTPDLPPLPAVPTELEVLARHFGPGEAHHQIAGPAATRAAVLNAVAGHSWLHLACHATQQQADPTRSGFVLWDGTLTMADVASLPSGRRDLAFLSACETATGSVRHLDEAIHLAAVLQFLGYRHIIATTWTIADSPAPRVADRVYAGLSQPGGPDARLTAQALHEAVGSLRQEDPTDPVLWGPYVHFGP